MLDNKPLDDIAGTDIRSMAMDDIVSVFDQHAIISIADVSGNITYVNDTFCKISGYGREELLGQNHRIVRSDAHTSEFFRVMWRTIAKGDVWQGQIQNRCKDGSPYWVQTTIMPILNDAGKPAQYISIRTDVTQQVQSERSLGKFKKILDQTLDSIFIFDAQTLKITYVNLGAAKQVGYTEPELLNMSPLDIKTDYDEPQFRTMLFPLQQGKVDSLTFETVHRHKLGQELPVEVVLQHIPERKGSGQFIAIVRDISERVRTINALKALTVADPVANVFHAIAKTVSDTLQARWVGIGKISENGCEVELLGFWDTDCEAALFNYPLEGAPCNDVCTHGQSIFIPENVVECYPDDELLREIGAVSYRGEPLLTNDGVELGVLFAIDDSPCGDETTDRALMRVAAKRAALELQRQEAEGVAKKRSRRLYETMERISDGFFSLDDQWKFTFLNNSAANIFDVAWEDVKGRSIWDVLPDMGEDFKTHLHRSMKEQRRLWVDEFEFHERWLALYAYPSPEGVSVYMQDTTEYKYLKQQHKRMEKQVRQSQKMEAIGQLTAGIAHDFNNILASINGYTDLALTRCVGEGQEKLEEYLGQVYKAGERARDLVQQMMDYSRGSTAEVMALDPRPIIEETVKLLRSTLPASIHLSFECPTDDNVIISMEPVQLQQMIMNLCVNARDAMQGNGQLTLRLEQMQEVSGVCASCHDTVSGEYVVLSVSDTGEGMIPETAEHLFEPFFTTKDVGEGTGLGLSVIHGIVHEHQGHIHVTSAPGEGATFSLLFPKIKDVLAKDVSPRQAEISNVDNLAMTSQKVSGKQVLIVDDESSLLMMLQDRLESSGFEVHAFVSASDAFAYFETHFEEIDLLITDQTMPGLTGKELIEKVMVINPHLPTVLCSGYSDQINAMQAEALGIDYFVKKPFSHGPFLAEINRLLDL